MRPGASPGWLTGDFDDDLTRTGWQSLARGDHDLCRPTTNSHDRGIAADGHHDDVCDTGTDDHQIRDADYRSGDPSVATVKRQPACAGRGNDPDVCV